MSSENIHYSMKDSQNWNQQDIEMFERDELSSNNMTPKEFAEGQPDWDEKIGICTQLLFRVLEEQNGMIDVSAFDFMYMIQEFAISVIAHRAPCTLDQAYEIAGYDMKPTFSVEINGSCSGTIVVSGNTDPVLF